MKDTAVVKFYRDRKREWRWKLVAPNGRIIADSGEGYQRYEMARKGWDALVAYVNGGVVP